MKTINYLFVLLFSVALFACNDNDDSELTKADFTVLGITSATVNNSVYSINDDMKLTNTGTKIVITNFGYEEAQKHSTLAYFVLLSEQTMPSVSITSRYSDVSIVETSATTSEGIPQKTFDITRSGYKEHFTYVFYFSIVK